MGTTAIGEHTALFKTLLAESGVKKNSPLAIDYYQRSLNAPLLQKLLELPILPKDLDEWYEWASRLDNNYQKQLQIIGQLPKKDDKRKEGNRRQ